jgi:ABC-type multidrug transport system ATPase subunit
VRFKTGFRKPPLDALVDVSLEVRSGEIVGILGPNGAGKTTALRVLAGLLRPDAGRTRVLGRSPADRALVSLVGYQPEGPLPLPQLNGAEFLHYMGNLMRLERATLRAAVDYWLERLSLVAARHRAIEGYSTGMRRRLALATALLGDPQVLLLDEPTSGLDPEGSELVMEILQQRAAAGGAVLMASHHLQEVEQICHRVYVFDQGRIARSGTLDELLGTGATRLVVRDLDADGLAAVAASIHAAGGTLESQSADRDHLNAFYRRLREPR